MGAAAATPVAVPVGGPIIGLVSQHASPRYGLLIGALSCLLAAALGAAATRHAPPATRGGGGRPALMDWSSYEQAHTS